MNIPVSGKTMKNARTYNNQIKKELFVFRTTLSHSKMIFRKIISNRNEKNGKITMFDI